MPTTKRTTPFNPDQLFTTKAEDHPSQTYSAQDLREQIGDYDTSYYTDEKLQRIADVFSCNLDDVNDPFDFNDCEADMKHDLLEYLLAT